MGFRSEFLLYELFRKGTFEFLEDGILFQNGGNFQFTFCSQQSNIEEIKLERTISIRAYGE